MPDVDSNGVDILDRFRAYKSRFMQFSVTEDVFNQVVEYIKELRKERDEARRDLCDLYVKGQPSSSNMTDKDYAAELGWDCFKEDGK